MSRKGAWPRVPVLDPEASPGRGLSRALSQTLVNTIKAMTDSDKEEEVKQKLTDLTKESGVEGADRLAALFVKRHGPEARTMSLAKLKSLSNAVLKLGLGKQILAFPQNLSGGRIHASSPNEVWQADTASMFTFGGGYFLCVVDVFTRRTWAEPMACLLYTSDAADE